MNSKEKLTRVKEQNQMLEKFKKKTLTPKK